MTFSAGLAGFVTGFSLILAIGAQNAFVLRQGLARRYVFTVCAICAISDALLIAAGVAGAAAIIHQVSWLEDAMRYGGAAFLIWYGWRSFRSAQSPGTLAAAERGAGSWGEAVAICLAFTWLNPHVYIDTVALIGSISADYPAYGPKLSFAIGAVSSSFFFFFSLGYGARLLTPIFARPAAWRVLDVVVGLMMWGIAALLLFA